MALHINLYHEIEKQKHARQRDPLKLGMIGLAVITLAFAGYYFYRLGSVHDVNVRLGALEQDWSKLEPKLKAAKTREEELNAMIKLSEALVKHIEGRFYWAPVFERVMQSVPREVQITRINGDLAADRTKPSIINLTGISSGDEPRKVAEDLRTALYDELSGKFKSVSSSFKSLEEGETPAALNGRRYPTANFAMEFQITTTEPEPTPAPARKPKIAAQ